MDKFTELKYILGTCFMCAQLVVYVLALPPSTNPGIIARGQCEPNCTCSVNGQSYSEGDKWSSPADPCTVYQCMSNGRPKRVERGCAFNEVCKDVGTTWTDKCNTFTCKNGTDIAYYSLQEAGCELQTGECMRVGERRDAIGQDTCDVIECQLNGGQLQVTETQTGCRASGECRSINSYWYDGCVVFTCAKENDTLTPLPVRDVMHWPDGDYALLEPSTGCPQDDPALWRRGSRTHFGAGRNSFSAQRSAYVSSTDVFLRHEFCVHTTPVGTEQTINGTSGLVTVWGPGSYCLFRRKGVCPEGFTSGFLQFDDNDARAATRDGYLPDGDFTPDTGLYFCCRQDGSILSQITLPTEASFILFPTNTEKRCQAVNGMVPSLESVTLDGTRRSNHTLTGSLPVITISQGDVTLYYCHYTQVGCAGCPDGHGGYLDINTEKQTKCVVKKCVQDNGVNVLKTIKGGCEHKERCREEGEVWHESTGGSGSTCEHFTCRRMIGTDGVGFVTESLGKGCYDDAMCHDIGATAYKNCYTNRCLYNETTQTAAFETIHADCPWLNSCKAVNTTWQQGCMLYRCDLDTSQGLFQWNVQPVDYGCDDGTGKCLMVGEKVVGKCYDAVCRVSDNKTVVYLDVVQGGCNWRGGCKKVNETWQHGCHDFRCEWSDWDTGFTAVVNATKVSCEWNGTCYLQNSTWTDGCVEYKCMVTRHAEEVNWSVETVRVACRDFNGSCVDVGNSFTENCVTYQCQRRGDRLKIEPVSVGCNSNQGCHAENSTWMDDRTCARYQCQKMSRQGRSFMQNSVVGYGCAFNGTCKPANATWLDGCKTRKCRVVRTGRAHTMSVGAIAAGCDDKGICRPEGYTKVSNTCMEYECIFNRKYKEAFFTLASGACQGADKTCHAVNSTWREDELTMCLKYECRQEKIGYLSKMIQQDCRDIRGVCRPVGSSGFEAISDGKLQSNCRCDKTVKQDPGVEINCNP